VPERGLSFWRYVAIMRLAPRPVNPALPIKVVSLAIICEKDA